MLQRIFIAYGRKKRSTLRKHFPPIVSFIGKETQGGKQPDETQEDGSQSQDTTVAKLSPASLSSTAEWGEEMNPSTSLSLVFPRKISDSTVTSASFVTYL